ncbi:MAG: response regulator transcription factor [Cyanobacteria bacterium P01_C01_bin.89]
MTETPAKLLVVDDDPAIRNLIHRFLSKKDYLLESAGDGKTALSLFEEFQPDLVILDINLPDTTGYDLCLKMRAKTDVYVLMLTSLADESDKIKGFSQGADDWITKPFSLIELGFRVGAILNRRRSAPVKEPEQETLSYGGLVVDPERREILLNEDSVSLTALEFNLLYFLARNAGKVWSRQALLQRVWEYDYVGDPRVVDVHIGQIRRKLGTSSHHARMIQTVRGVGYRFTPPEDPEEK